jgi:hypothetical protein
MRFVILSDRSAFCRTLQTRNNSAGNTRKRCKGDFIEDEPDQDGEIARRVHEYRVEPVLFAVRLGPVAHELSGACAISVNLDNGFTIDIDLPPRIEDNAIRVIRDLKYVLLTHCPHKLSLKIYKSNRMSPRRKTTVARVGFESKKSVHLSPRFALMIIAVAISIRASQTPYSFKCY